jgi:histidinol phosphatase-like PHP family hydrolase
MNDIERQAERAMRRINESMEHTDHTDNEEAGEPESAMQMLAYLLIAVAVTAAAILLSFFITR